jgi:hypothetical protein
MPTFIAFAKKHKLRQVEIHYCMLGRDTMKPTHIWTNVEDLYQELAKKTYQCNHDGAHESQVRGTTHLRNHSKIPEQLADVFQIKRTSELLGKPAISMI